MELPPAIPERELAPADALRLAFDLYQFGEDVMRQNLRREHPGESEAEIEARVVAWLHERPGAEQGDAQGRPCNRLRLGE